MAIHLRAAALTDKGRQRELNEDTVYQKVVDASDEAPTGLLIVADGVGGHLGGEVASYRAVETIKKALADLFRPHDPKATIQFNSNELINPQDVIYCSQDRLTDRVETAMQRANTVVRQYARQRPGETNGAATTLSMALICGSEALIANVGDSRTYLLRENQLRQITTDHSFVQRLIEERFIEADQRYIHPQRNVIYRALGASDSVEVDVFALTLFPGDFLVLCTDGLWEMVRSPDELVGIIQKASSVQDACERLVAAANVAGGEDNVGVVVVEVYEGNTVRPTRESKADATALTPSLVA